MTCCPLKALLRATLPFMEGVLTDSASQASRDHKPYCWSCNVIHATLNLPQFMRSSARIMKSMF